MVVGSNPAHLLEENAFIILSKHLNLYIFLANRNGYKEHTRKAVMGVKWSAFLLPILTIQVRSLLTSTVLIM